MATTDETGWMHKGRATNGITRRGVVHAVKMAAERIRQNRERGYYRAPLDGTDPVEMDAYAVGGEMAFAALVGIEPQLLREEWRGQPNGTLPALPFNGIPRPYNVSQTPRRYGQLLAPKRNRSTRRDVLYVLLTREGWTYTFRGMAWGETLVQPQNEWCPNFEWCYALRQYALSDLQLT